MFTAKGFTNAWGEYAYGDNKSSKQVQEQVVSDCYAYGRKYTNGVNVESTMTPIGFQGTNSITGGPKCSDPTASCYTSNGKVYQLPSTFETLLSRETGGEWIALQFYRLVTGSSRYSPTFSWDCTSSNSVDHWTSQTEMYCANDFDAILGAEVFGAITTDPATVATAWGETPPR
jgi:hypothetical protein